MHRLYEYKGECRGLYPGKAGGEGNFSFYLGRGLSLTDSSRDKQAKREEHYFLPLRLQFVQPDSKSSLSDSATWCEFRTHIPQLTLVRTLGTVENHEEKMYK